MNKTMKLKDLIKLLRESQRIMLCECNWNGDIIQKSPTMYVGNKEYTTYLENHIKQVECHGNLLYIFI